MVALCEGPWEPRWPLDFMMGPKPITICLSDWCPAVLLMARCGKRECGQTPSFFVRCFFFGSLSCVTHQSNRWYRLNCDRIRDGDLMETRALKFEESYKYNKIACLQKIRCFSLFRMICEEDKQRLIVIY